ncbi:MAG: AAA family ATPase [Mycolicibacterium sp.]|uniref:AAA family ATPase n=1 Tax=Mycolicibacterium sp. TaxID=2320850 RepID=UPI003D0DF6B0
MKLHRLTLTNYRGIAHRDIEFPDRGVVIVSGANEVGKTSMLEALDLLLEAKDRSTKKEVKQVKPTHADVGAEVMAEISTGPYRFVYRKRFHKRAETELTLLTPRREQLTGDDAHERVRAMLTETVDLDLWRAQRVLQSASTAAADLSGCNALSRALDVVAGEVDEAPGGASAAEGNVDTLLIDRIDEEYRRYFTSTGRPTGEWAATISRLQSAEANVAACIAAVAEVDEALRRHTVLTEELGVLADESGRALERLAAARTAAEAVDTLSGELDRAIVLADAATSTHAASLAALTERRRTRADIEGRLSAIDDLRAVAEEAATELADAGAVQAAADRVAADSRSALEASRARVDAAHGAVQRLADRAQAERLTTRINAIEAHQRDLASVRREFAAISLTRELMQTIEEAASVVDRAAIAAQEASAHMELVAGTMLELQIGGEPVSLRAGDTWAGALTGPTGVEVPGVLTVRVTPGAPAATTAAALEAAQEALSGALDQAGVADVAAARALDGRRRDLLNTDERLLGIIDALTAEGDATELRSRLSELQPDPPGGDRAGSVEPPQPQELTALRAELDAADAAHRQAVQDCETHRKVAEEAARLLAERGVRAARAREKLQAAEAELALLVHRLDTQRVNADDDQLAVKAETDSEAANKAQERVSGLRAELACHQPEVVAAELTDAQQHGVDVARRRDQAEAALREVTIQLKVYGTEGRKGRLDVAETEQLHAAGEFQATQRRARAAQLLRSVMGRHRQAMRQRYVDPFRCEVERLGRLVFDESFEVDVDSDLRIGHRTLSGCTVPYESLSGGTKEQLGIVARLAAATLVAKEDSVPVVIDDALGFTDAERLAKMAKVFDTVASESQVIILTCSPDRYAGVRCARRIELTATGSD